MEATMEVEQQDEKERNLWRTVTKARFVMVSRDPLNKGAAFVNPLIAETDEEKALFRYGEGRFLLNDDSESKLIRFIIFLYITENKERRMRMQSQSLIRSPPSEEERLVIHEQFLRTVRDNLSSVFLKELHF